MSKEKIKTEEKEAASIQEGKVGTMLHDVRVKKKLSIEDTAKALRIKAAYLTAIEQSDYDNIPKPPYGIGFVRSYASYLGLNSERLVQIFKEEIGSTTPHTPVYTVQAGNDGDKENAEIYKPNGKYIVISLGLLLAVYLLWSAFGDEEAVIEEIEQENIVSETTDNNYPLQIETFSDTQNATEENTDSQVTMTDEEFVEEITEETIEDKKEQPAAETAEEETTSEEQAAPAKKQGRVVLKVKKETWIEVKDKDKLWLSKVLKAGDEYTLPENGKGKTVSFGNTDGVDVVIDGKIVTIVSSNKKTNIQMDAFLGNH